MVLDSGPLTVELVVGGPGRSGAVGAALHSGADRSGTHLLRSALGNTTDKALREHGGWCLGVLWWCEVRMSWVCCKPSLASRDFPIT